MTARQRVAVGCPFLVLLATAGGAAFADSAAQCGDRSEWTAQPRDWMTGKEAWCALEVGFRYAGSSGEIKVAVKREGSARSTRGNLASVDLPANGGQTSTFQFIFPCATERAAEMCLVYERAADALELSYDYLELGVDADSTPDTVPAQYPELLLPPELAAAGPNRLSTAAEARSRLLAAVAVDAVAQPDLGPSISQDFRRLGAVEPAPPVAVPIGELRRRAR